MMVKNDCGSISTAMRCYSHAGLALVLVFLHTAHCQTDVRNDTTVIKRQIDEKDEADADRESRGVFTDWFLQQKGVLDDSEERLDPVAAHADRKKHRRNKFLNHWCDWFGKHNHTTNDSRICGLNNSTEDAPATTEQSPSREKATAIDLESPVNIKTILGLQGIPDTRNNLLESSPPTGGNTDTTSYQRIIVIHKVKQTVREKRSHKKKPKNFIDVEHPSPNVTQPGKNSSCSSSSSAEESHSIEQKKPYFFV